MSPAPGLHEDEEDSSPLDQGAAAPPRVMGGGCLARYDPEALNADSGADFTQAQALLQSAIEAD